MNATTLARILWLRRSLRGHERWTRLELERNQTKALHELRAFAYRHSRFYQRFHDGLYDRPLHELPVLTKADLMEEFDDLVTDPRVHLADVREYLASSSRAPFLGRYWVAVTAGSSGLRGVFLTNPGEWATVLASYARANEWAGVKVGLTRHMKLAVISSLDPSHQSAIVGKTLESRFVPTLRLSALDPLDQVVSGLNDFQPDSLAGYASMLRVLAEEQIAGRLKIAPGAVLSASEVLTTASAQRMEQAWDHAPFNTYAATETAGIASQCPQHRNLHLYEDLLIIEVVDDQNRPAPMGSYGAKLLVTVLFNRTQPLIRYEIGDCVRLAAGDCPCGRPFACIDGIEGRLRDVLEMAGADGGRVWIHPHVFYSVLESVPATGWQVVQENDGRLRVLLAGADDAIDDDAVLRAVAQALVRQGATRPPMRIERVTTVTRTALGKAPLVRAAERLTA